MVPSLLAAAALTAPAAPVPKDTVPNPAGPAPRVAGVKAEADGVVWVTAQVYEKRKVQQQMIVVENNQRVQKVQEVEQTVPVYVRKTLADFGGKFATAGGSPLTPEDAVRRVRDGATLLVTADGKPVSPGWLKAVDPSAVVMTADGLGHAHFSYGGPPYPTTPAPRLAMLGTDDKGVVRLPVNPNPTNPYGQVYYGDDGGFGGGRIIRGGGRVIIEGDVAYAPAPAAAPAAADGKKALTDLSFTAYEVNGKMLSKAAALDRLKAGGLVLIAGDSRFPDAQYLTAFRDDLVVIASPELVFPPNLPNPYDVPPKPAAPAANPAGGKPAPAVAPPAPAVAPAIGVARPAVLKPLPVQIEK
ncbi:MAG: hypothetical protein C0501_00600 [Isosphaera sp.]|nr:hypothetical protein [Isosphaera sp.]